MAFGENFVVEAISIGGTKVWAHGCSAVVDIAVIVVGAIAIVGLDANLAIFLLAPVTIALLAVLLLLPAIILLVIGIIRRRR